MLFASELLDYTKTRQIKTMGVDATRDALLDINIDMTYPGLPCQVLSLDALDMSGKHDVNIGGSLNKAGEGGRRYKSTQKLQKLDPGLKAPCSQPCNLRVHTLRVNSKPC